MAVVWSNADLATCAVVLELDLDDFAIEGSQPPLHQAGSLGGEVMVPSSLRSSTLFACRLSLSTWLAGSRYLCLAGSRYLCLAGSRYLCLAGSRYLCLAGSR